MNSLESKPQAIYYVFENLFKIKTQNSPDQTKSQAQKPSQQSTLMFNAGDHRRVATRTNYLLRQFAKVQDILWTDNNNVRRQLFISLLMGLDERCAGLRQIGVFRRRWILNIMLSALKNCSLHESNCCRLFCSSNLTRKNLLSASIFRNLFLVSTVCLIKSCSTLNSSKMYLR